MSYLVYVYAGTSLYVPVINASFGKFSSENLFFSRGSQYAGYYIVGVGPNDTFPTTAPGYNTVQSFTDAVDPNTTHFNVQLTPTPTPPPPPVLHGDHFYTTSAAERDSAINNFGYQAEGIACYTYALEQPSTFPLYRLLNNNNGDHFYTASAAERDSAVAKFGYHYEGIACYVYEVQSTDTTPFYRLYRP